MTSPLCDMGCECEDCGDREVCDIYYAEKGFRLLEAQFEEDWHERRYAEKVAL
jgi:hypothetical protein